MHDEGREINEGRRSRVMARHLHPFLRGNEDRRDEQNCRDHDNVSGLRRVEKDPDEKGG